MKEVQEKYPGRYKVISNYINNKTKVTIEHISCGNHFDITPTNLLRDRGCPSCNRPNYNTTTEEFAKRVEKERDGEYSLIGEYINYESKVDIKHNECGYVWSILPGNLLNLKRGCPICGKIKQNESMKLNPSEFAKRFKEKADPECELLSEYRSSTEKVKVRHKTCGHVWESLPSNITKGRSCPMCYSSEGEKEIMEWFKTNAITFYKEHKFDDCKYKRHLRFDFYIPSHNTCIEYDGELHFDVARYDKNKMNENLELNQKRDAIKDRYCKDNSISLLRIPYTEKDNLKDILSAYFL